jgi:hypothetical protein
MAQPMFEVRVAGVVPEADLRDLSAVTLSTGQVRTVLYGIDDQAALYGLLARLRALGLEVMEVRRVRDPSAADAETDRPAAGTGRRSSP